MDTTLVNLTTSWLADFNPLKPFLVAMLVAFSLGACGLLNLHAQSGYWLLVIGFGAGSGLWGTLSNLAYVRYFGRLYLGEVSGLSTSLTVFASAIGPALFSLGSDAFGSYQAAECLCLSVLICLTIATILIRQDESQDESSDEPSDKPTAAD
jgi:cyanate permease